MGNADGVLRIGRNEGTIAGNEVTVAGMRLQMRERGFEVEAYDWFAAGLNSKATIVENKKSEAETNLASLFAIPTERSLDQSR